MAVVRVGCVQGPGGFTPVGALAIYDRPVSPLHWRAGPSFDSTAKSLWRPAFLRGRLLRQVMNGHRLSFRTAGESHGRGLTALIEGVPAGLPLEAVRDIDPELKRRQAGYGRGRRMQIESDTAEVLSGIRLGETLGSPISIVVWNRDWENWTTAMSHLPPASGENPKALKPVYLPRPGHADLVGMLKYDRWDARDILERASARETAVRVASGAVAKRLLSELGITIGSHVLQIGSDRARIPEVFPEDLNGVSDRSCLRTLDSEIDELMKSSIDQAKEDGDTLGGIFEIVVRGLPVGLGSHVAWDRKLDGRLAQAIMSIQAVKGVEVGPGFENAGRSGSTVHDAIIRDDSFRTGGGFGRSSNRAGGLEGGITTGEPLLVRGAMKPISTLRARLPSVDMRDGEARDAAHERSDVCAVPAAAVIGESMVALVLADAVLEKFGADSMSELRRNVDSYLDHLRDRGFGERPTSPPDPG